MSVSKGEFAEHAVPGAQFACHVTPRAGREAVALRDGIWHLRVTAPPEDGKANKAVLRLMARALGVAPSRLELVRGQSGRDKLLRLAGD